MGYEVPLDTFRSNDKLTRQEAMAIFARVMIITKLNTRLTDD